MPPARVRPPRIRLSSLAVSLSSSPIWATAFIIVAGLLALVALPPGRAARIAGALPLLLPPGPFFTANAARTAGSLALPIVLLVACHSLGRIALGWLGAGGSRGPRLPAAAPAGFLLASTALLGAGLAGLWFAPLLFAGLLLPALAGLGAGGRADAGALRRFLRSAWAGTPLRWRAAWLLLAAWWLPVVTLPDLTIDAISYHLALPAQALLGHRLAAAGTFAPWMMPLPADLPNALPLALGLEPAGRIVGLVLAVLGAACFVRAALPAQNLPAHLLLLAVVAGLMAPEASGVLGTAKGDSATCGWALAGAGLLLDSGFVRRRRRPETGALLAGAVLLGAAATSKWVLAPFPVALLAVAVASAAPGTRRILAALSASGLALPAVPWLIRSWLAFGDPLPPVGSAFLPSLFPGVAGSADSRFVVAWRLAAAPQPSTTRIPGPLLILFRNSLFPLAALALFGGSRKPGPGRIAVAALAGAAIMVAGAGGLRGHADRYAYPAFALLATAGAALLLARERRPRFLVPGLAALAVLFHLRAAMPAPWGDPGREARAAAYFAGHITGGEYREAGLASYGRLLPRLREAMDRDPGRPRRVIGVCALMYHGIPAPVAPDGDYAPPFAWRAVHESADASRLAVKFRQAGAGWLLYDPDLACWKKLEPSPWGWDTRMLGLWDGFFRAHASVAAAVPCAGPGDGAGLLYRLGRPARPPSGPIPYLPGTESAFRVPALLAARGRYGDAERALRPLSALLPGVGDVRALMGHILTAEGRYAEALPALRAAESAGVIGCVAPVTLNRAVAAGRMGLRGEAEEALRCAAATLTAWPARVEQARKDSGL